MRAIQRAALAAVFILGANTRAEAQLPTVQQVYDKYASAIGGRDVWAKVNDRAEKGTADITFAGISGTYEMYRAAPNKLRLIIDLGMGKVEQGSDGDVVWTAQPDGSVAKMPEPDATYAREANVTGPTFLDHTAFAKVAVTGQEEFDGVPCYKVSITTKAGRERTDYFEVATGLRRAQLVQSAAGLQKTVYRDYKAFEGKMIATKQVLTNPQGDIVLTINTVTFTPNDSKLFDLPAGISK